jgi:hypothetical protein
LREALQSEGYLYEEGTQYHSGCGLVLDRTDDCHRHCRHNLPLRQLMGRLDRHMHDTHRELLFRDMDL